MMRLTLPDNPALPVAPDFWRGAASVRDAAADEARLIGHPEGERYHFRIAEQHRARARQMEEGEV